MNYDSGTMSSNGLPLLRCARWGCRATIEIDRPEPEDAEPWRCGRHRNRPDPDGSDEPPPSDRDIDRAENAYERSLFRHPED